MAVVVVEVLRLGRDEKMNLLREQWGLLVSSSALLGPLCASSPQLSISINTI